MKHDKSDIAVGSPDPGCDTALPDLDLPTPAAPMPLDPARAGEPRLVRLRGTSGGGGPVQTQPKQVLCFCYARYSSEGQKCTSIIRQIEICEAEARRRGWQLVRVYKDAARSGVTLHGRPGLAALLADAAALGVEWVIVEQVDRLSRDEADLASVFKHLRRHGVTVLDCALGPIEGVKRGISGFMAQHVREQFLERSADGRARLVARGLFPHRPAYGYAKHPTIAGARTIHPARGAVVRVIYELYNSGSGTTTIARHLNERAEPAGDDGRAGVPWSAEAVRRILRNPLYAGVLADGLTRVVRDPETFEIVGRERRPREEWRVTDVPSMAIVTVEVWTKAQERLNANYDCGNRRAPHTHFVLTGLAFCATCGAIAKADGGEPMLRCSHG